MKITTDEQGEIVLFENYVGVLMRASDQDVGICERDGGFEIGVFKSDGSQVWYSIVGGDIAVMGRPVEGDGLTEGGATAR